MRRSPLTADPEKVRAFLNRGRASSAASLTQPRTQRKTSGFTPASAAQRRKVREMGFCVVCGSLGELAFMHLCARAKGGCDDPLCGVPGCRQCHRAFDDGKLDVLPHLLGHGLVPELQHALGHYEGNFSRLLERLTGERWGPQE